MLASIRIVLVETSHPGNIGAAARAMKNMGLADLRLVQPREFPHADAYARASGAEDVLNAAQVHDSLDAAVADCGLVAGTTARQRHLSLPVVEPREGARQLLAAAHDNRAALVFGAERTGLTNVELGRCNVLVTIPTSDAYSSLNVAMAVQLLAYELLLAAREGAAATGQPVQPAAKDFFLQPANGELQVENANHRPAAPLATAADMAMFYAHLEKALAGTDFRDHSGSGQLMARVRCLFNRAQPDQHEIRILRGMLSALESGKSY